jgi:hypothetical protein
MLLNKVAAEMGLKIGDVEKAYQAPFELQSIVMRYRCDREKQIFPSLRIPYFLIFYCPEWRKKQLKKRNEDCGFDKQPDSNSGGSVASETIQEDLG